MRNESFFSDLEQYRLCFKASSSQSIELSHRTSSSWFCFSEFVPSCFRQLLPFVRDLSIRSRINSIIEEEMGEQEGIAHSLLYKQAMEEIDVKIQDHEELSVTNLNQKIKQSLEKCNDKESFVVGLTFGLEVIAEENIRLLLKYSSPNPEAEKILKKTIFFKIHLQNEKEHIDKCWDNVQIMSKHNRLDELRLGYRTARNFWQNFWEGVAND